MFLTAVAESEEKFSIESIKALMDGFDPTEYLPDIGAIMDKALPLCRVAVLVGPLILLVLGVAYLALAPKEANHHFGYRTYFGMGSVNAWRYTQRMAAIFLGGSGLILTAVMLFISTRFAAMDPQAMLWLTVRCLLWEAAVALAANVTVVVIAALTFNHKGEVRRKRKRTE